MLTETKRTDLFCEYYAKWITVYKKGAIRKVTMDKYHYNGFDIHPLYCQLSKS